MFIININIIIRYVNVVPSILDQVALESNTTRHKIQSCSGSWITNALSKIQLIKIAIISRVPS